MSELPEVLSVEEVRRLICGPRASMKNRLAVYDSYTRLHWHTLVRGESGRKELWTAEEVEPLIEALSFLIVWTDDKRSPFSARWDEFAEVIDHARAALARFRTPAPPNEWRWGAPDPNRAADHVARRTPESEGTNE